jgi:hypothetical protein
MTQLAADTKAGALLAAHGLIISIILSNLETVETRLLARPWVAVPFYLAGVTLVLSMASSTWCLLPKLSVGEPDSHIYFYHIAEQFRTAESYTESFYSMFNSEGQPTLEIASQVWALAKVAWEKYRIINYSFHFFAATLFFILVSVILSIF